MSVCVAKASFFPCCEQEYRVTLEAPETTKAGAQVPVVEIIILDPQESTGSCTMDRLC